MPMSSLQNRFVSPPLLSQHQAQATPRPSGPPARRALLARSSLSNAPHDWHRRVIDKAREKHIQGLDPGQVAERTLGNKWLLIDVRPSDDFLLAHPKGAQNIPLFDAPQTPGHQELLKRMILRMNNVRYLAYNDTFVDAIHAAAAGGRGLIFADDTGGLLVREASGRRGQESRSLKALYIALEAGLTQVDYLQGGLRSGRERGMPFVGHYARD